MKRRGNRTPNARAASARKGAAVRTSRRRTTKSVRGRVAKRAARQDASPQPVGSQHVSWSGVPLDALNPLIRRQFVVGHDVMLARFLMNPGAIVPEHSHINEQITYVLEGALRFSLEGREVVVRAGEVLTIPPDLPHAVEAVEETVSIDIFNPPRADWIAKTDAYLRQK